MLDTVFQVLFLGEDSAWTLLSQALADAPKVALKFHRAVSLNELLLVLAGGQWHAAVLDVHAWNFQGLHYVEKVRAEYPAFPVLALYSDSVGDLDVKAKKVGASRCIPIDTLTAEALHSAVLSCISNSKSEIHLAKTPPIRHRFHSSDNSSSNSNKTEVISHALNNLLCVITANADMLDAHINSTGPGVRSLIEIKKAAKSAADLMRLLR